MELGYKQKIAAITQFSELIDISELLRFLGALSQLLSQLLQKDSIWSGENHKKHHLT